MQKEHYNNHYYLVMLIAWFMVFIPANRYKAVDVWLWPKIRSDYTYQWARLIFIIQLFIVYTFAAIVKMYPGWMNGDFLRIRYRQTAHWIDQNIAWEPLTKFVYSQEFAKIMSYLGFGFDLLIVPLLLWRRTRIYALVIALFFHLFNSITLHIGIFPYFAMALAVFFFSPESIRNAFFKKKTTYLASSYEYDSKYSNQSLVTVLFAVYILWQIYLPLRHWWIPGDVLWTEEGHRLSWRMMLRTKSATTDFFWVDKATGKREIINQSNYLTPLQKSRVATHPDMIWQFAQYLDRDFKKKGMDVEIYAQSQLSINGGPYFDYIDTSVDLTQVKWSYFGHQNWLLPEPENYSQKSKKK